MNNQLQTEQEGAIGLLIASVHRGENKISDAQIETILRIVVFCSKFSGADIKQLFGVAYPAHMAVDKNTFILQAASLIDPGFAQTLFAMCCEAVFSTRKWQESDSDTLATIGIALSLERDTIKEIVRTYIIRSMWNIEITG